MSGPMFSIVTVVRNDVVGTIKTMQSIFGQTFADYEVIVQDGNSTDGTSEVLRSFGTWIDSLVVEKDAGIYDAMNRALARCSGDWILFLNAADYFVDDRVLEKVACRVRPGSDIFVGVPIRDEDGLPHVYRPRDQFWIGSINDHQATFVRRELAQRLRFDTSFRIAGDLDFFLRAREAGAVEQVENLPIARKSFSVGASTDWLKRLSEREPILLEKFDGIYPVRETLDRELRNYVEKAYDVDRRVLDDWKYEELKDVLVRWNSVLAA